jgi:hypothetical protein
MKIIVRIYICISFAVSIVVEKEKRRIWQFSRIAATQFSLSPFLLYLFCLTRTEAEMRISNERKKN